SLPISSFDCFPVYALCEFLLHVLVAFRAGHRHIEFEDRRLGISGREDLVAAVAISANCRLGRTAGHRPAMHALFVRNKRLRAVAAGRHHELLPVTCTTCRGDIGMADSGIWIACREQLMRAAMAIHARGGLPISLLVCLGVKA